MQYRKRPIIIEATQFDPGDPTTHEHVNYGHPDDNHELCGKYWIGTLEGAMIVSPGDWIITGVAGEHYPCKDSIFQQTYERVE
jgi:hypothetical protein